MVAAPPITPDSQSGADALSIWSGIQQSRGNSTKGKRGAGGSHSERVLLYSLRLLLSASYLLIEEFPVR